MEKKDFIKSIDKLRSKRSNLMVSQNPEMTEVEISFIANRKYFYIEYNRGKYKIFNDVEQKKLVYESDKANDIIQKIKQIANINDN